MNWAYSTKNTRLRRLRGQKTQDYRHVVVALTGASGAKIGLRVARFLARTKAVRVHLIISPSARLTIAAEKAENELTALSHNTIEFYDTDNIAACIASGSFITHGMIVAPCSMHSLAAIANGIADNLIIRSAEVQLKERRKLILLARETPLHLGHIQRMLAVSQMGAIVMPPVPAFYHNPASVDDIIDDIALRAINLLELALPLRHQVWAGLPAAY